jgi:hypothetical protein
MQKIYGIGYRVNASWKNNERLYNVWMGMLKRCYDKNCNRYRAYGNIGIKVDKRWHCFDNFVEDAIKLPGWKEESFLNGQLQLDKDYMGQKMYSRYSCIWLPKELNNALQLSHAKAFKAISPDGTMLLSNNQRRLAKEYNLNLANMNRCLKGLRKSSKGWRFEYIL